MDERELRSVQTAIVEQVRDQLSLHGGESGILQVRVARYDEMGFSYWTEYQQVLRNQLNEGPARAQLLRVLAPPGRSGQLPATGRDRLGRVDVQLIAGTGDNDVEVVWLSQTSPKIPPVPQHRNPALKITVGAEVFGREVEAGVGYVLQRQRREPPEAAGYKVLELPSTFVPRDPVLYVAWNGAQLFMMACPGRPATVAESTGERELSQADWDPVRTTGSVRVRQTGRDDFALTYHLDERTGS